MSSPPSLVWYVLLDSATGKPYKGTTADAILLSSGSVVVQFRRAVKAEHSNKLSSVDAADLLVYQNKDAFDKRNAAVNEGKEEPLDPTESLVDGLGKSKIEALVVVVPSILQLSFELCQLPFFNNICDATESDGKITFGQDIPSTSLKDLYIRDCYRTIASNVSPGINKVIITGTPGIGKSLFLIYLLWKLVREGKRVLFIYHPFNIYYDGIGGVFRLASGNLPRDSDDSFWNQTLWCLYDARGQTETYLNKLPYPLCTFVVSNPLRREMVNDFQKPPVPQVFYVPTWTEAELEAIAPLFPNAKDWRDRFEILGGIPRDVLEVTTRTPTKILEIACMNCSLDDCVKKIGMNSTSTEQSSHFLIHVTSVPPFTNSSVCYASPTALNIIVRYKGSEAKRRMSDLLASGQDNPLIVALCGYISEPCVIGFAEERGHFYGPTVGTRKRNNTGHSVVD